MALTSRNRRENQLALPENVGNAVQAVVNFFSRNVDNATHLDERVIGEAIQHIRVSGNEFGGDALDALEEAADIVVKHSSNQVSTYDANKKLSQLATRIRDNRGFIGAVIGDTISTITPMKAGVAGAFSAGALYWSWFNFIRSLTAIQQIAMSPAGAVATAGAVKNFIDFLPEGGFSWYEYIKLGLTPDAIAGIIPDISQVEQQLANAGQVVSQKAGIFGTIINYGASVVDQMVGGTFSGASRIARTDVEYAHAQLGNYVAQASGSARTVTNVFNAWISVFLLILICYIGSHVYRSLTRKRNTNNELAGEWLFRSKRSNNKKIAKKSVKRSAKKKHIVKNVKKSVKRSAKKKHIVKNVKKSAKRSAKKKSIKRK